MLLVNQTDEEILKIAEPIRQDVIDGSNSKSWEQHSKHMPLKVIENDEIKKDVERQWREVDYLSALSSESELVAIIRKKDSITVCWKQTSTLSSDEYLLKIRLVEIDGEVKQIMAHLD